MRRPAKKRATSPQPKYQHNYANSLHGVSRTWGNLTPELRATIKRIDSVPSQADAATTPDRNGSVSVQKATGLTCANCGEWKSVFWVRAWSLAARVRPGVPVKCRSDMCVTECLDCGNWKDFWATKTVERSYEWGGGNPELGIPHRPTLKKTGVLVAPEVKYI